MNTNKVILTDIDGVVLDWEYSFRTWMEFHGYEIVDKSDYHIYENYGFSKEEGKECVRRFNESAAIGFLPALRDSAFFIKLLTRNLGFTFVGVTSLSLEPNAHKLRQMNLDKLFGEGTFSEMHYLDTGADKDSKLEELCDKYNGSIFIEDKYKNAVVARELGYDTFLMEHSYNMHEDDHGMTKIMNWAEIYDLMIDDERI